MIPKSTFIFVLAILFLMPFGLQAQETDLPESWFLPLSEKPEMIVLPPLDIEQILEEDLINDQDKNLPWRYGIIRNLDVNSDYDGKWTELPDGGKLWQLVIHSPDALNLSFIIENMDLPPGSKFQLFNDDHTDITNTYSALQYQNQNRIGTWFVTGDTVWLEYFQPARVSGKPNLEIKSVIHGYRLGKLNALFSPEGHNDSGACHHDVNCPIGNDFDALKDELKKAVALLNLGNGFLCTGVLINNTNADKTPYLLTANHCLDASDPDLWSVRFNWINPEPICGEDKMGMENHTNLTMSGTTLKAQNAKSDFALVQLNQSIPDSWDVVFAGWDNSDAEPLFEVGIHHPKGDIMKICRDDSGAEKSIIDGKEVWLIGGGSKGFGNGWEIGTTEKGSSGSPLFNEKGKIIGQLFGGDAGCDGIYNNQDFDAYGRFAVSWNAGSDASSRLKDWLDPIGSGQESIETLQNILNVPDFETIQDLTIYPNPASTTITIINNQYPHLYFELYTSLGQKIHSADISNTMNEISVENLANGVYFLRVYNENSKDAATKKILIQR